MQEAGYNIDFPCHPSLAWSPDYFINQYCVRVQNIKFNIWEMGGKAKTARVLSTSQSRRNKHKVKVKLVTAHCPKCDILFVFSFGALWGDIPCLCIQLHSQRYCVVPLTEKSGRNQVERLCAGHSDA